MLRGFLYKGGRVSPTARANPFTGSRPCPIKQKTHRKVCFLFGGRSGGFRFAQRKSTIFRTLPEFSSLPDKTKNTPQGVLFVWWTIRGLSLRSKKIYDFPNPFTGSRPCPIKQKNTPQGVLFVWWTIRDSKPEPVAKMRQK